MLSFLQEENNVWQTLKNCGQPVVLYGMGDGADKVLRAFERFGIQPAAVMASDAFVRGQRFHGFTVQKMSDLEQSLGALTVALCFASRLPDVMAHIKEVARRHRLLVPPVAPFGDVLFDDAFVRAYGAEIQAAEQLMADEQSRRVYRGVLRFYHTGEIGLLDEITTDKDEAFRTLLRLGDNEVYVDLGAYNGDTIGEFLHYTGGSYRKIVALEPNAKTLPNCRQAAAACRGRSCGSSAHGTKTPPCCLTTRQAETAPLPTGASKRAWRQWTAFSAARRRPTSRRTSRAPTAKPCSAWKRPCVCSRPSSTLPPITALRISFACRS